MESCGSRELFTCILSICKFDFSPIFCNRSSNEKFLLLIFGDSVTLGVVIVVGSRTWMVLRSEWPTARPSAEGRRLLGLNPFGNKPERSSFAAEDRSLAILSGWTVGGVDIVKPVR